MSEAPAITRNAGRPPFIRPEDFRAWLTIGALSRLMRVGGIMAGSYVARCEREGRPIPHRILHGCSRCWRPLDVVARARAHCLAIEPPEEAALRQSIEELRSEHALLSKIVSRRRHALGLAPVAQALTGATLLTEAEIAAGRIEMPKAAGVYFLLQGGRVVYVGQSVNVFGRVHEHAGAKSFDGFAYVPCEPEKLDALESLYIHTLRPELNGKWRGSTGMVAPLRLDDLLHSVK